MPSSWEILDLQPSASLSWGGGAFYLQLLKLENRVWIKLFTLHLMFTVSVSIDGPCPLWAASEMGTYVRCMEPESYLKSVGSNSRVICEPLRFLVALSTTKKYHHMQEDTSWLAWSWRSRKVPQGIDELKIVYMLLHPIVEPWLSC